MADEDQERHINLQTTPEIMAGHYANFANVSHSDYEFSITFARVDHEVEEQEVPGVVVTDRRAGGQLQQVENPRGHQEPARDR